MVLVFLTSVTRMARLLLVLIFIVKIINKIECKNDVSKKCNGFQANFDMKSVIGPWNVVAVIPEKIFPQNESVTCYKVEFSETDEASLRWLANSTIEKDSLPEIMENINGTIIRQRYYSERPFDIWSKAIENVNGCFQQVLSLDTKKSNIGKTLSRDALMQLHIVDTNDNSGPFLLQMLWGKVLSAVVYRRYQGVTLYQLKPVIDLMSRLRGSHKPPLICSRLPDLLSSLPLL